MALTTWLENWFMGDKNFRRNLVQTHNMGRDVFNAAGLERSGDRRQLSQLAGDFQSQINAGGLTDAMRRGFQLQRGRAQDIAARGLNAARQNMGQRRLESGGNLSAEAAAELEMLGAEGVNQQLFDANLGIDTTEAQMSQEATQALQDRILAIRESLLGSSERERAMGLQALLGALELRFKRNKAIADTTTSIIGASAGTGGFGGGGGGK